MDNAPIGRFAATRLVHNRFYFRDHNLIDRALVALALEPDNIGPSKTVLADIECAFHESDELALSDIRVGVFNGYRRAIEPLIDRLALLNPVAAVAALDEQQARYKTRLPLLLSKHSKTLDRLRTLMAVKRGGSNVVAIPFSVARK